MQIERKGSEIDSLTLPTHTHTLALVVQDLDVVTLPEGDR